ncbi:hypothetical protein [Micromonospora sp. NPDC049679]|uniref:hypothetical protein n=1 Tax=Micromonospora sp. NPDC049679 TaxID=3155920 RepID=UPI0033CEBBCF
MSDYRAERDTMGEVEVPVDALWGAQTQRGGRRQGQRFFAEVTKPVLTIGRG